MRTVEQIRRRALRLRSEVESGDERGTGVVIAVDELGAILYLWENDTRSWSEDRIEPEAPKTVDVLRRGKTETVQVLGVSPDGEIILEHDRIWANQVCVECGAEAGEHSWPDYHPYQDRHPELFSDESGWDGECPACGSRDSAGVPVSQFERPEGWYTTEGALYYVAHTREVFLVHSAAPSPTGTPLPAEIEPKDLDDFATPIAVDQVAPELVARLEEEHE